MIYKNGKPVSDEAVQAMSCYAKRAYCKLLKARERLERVRRVVDYYEKEWKRLSKEH